MSYLLTFFHIVVCLLLIAVVLLQTGKRADLAGAFGGGGSQTAFGARGAATLLSRFTTWAAVIFLLTSFGLSMISNRHSGGAGSVLDGQATAPSVPAAPPAGTTPESESPAPAPAPAPETPEAPAPTPGN